MTVATGTGLDPLMGAEAEAGRVRRLSKRTGAKTPEAGEAAPKPLTTTQPASSLRPAPAARIAAERTLKKFDYMIMCKKGNSRRRPVWSQGGGGIGVLV